MSDAGPGALAGVRVLDLSRVLAGPWATQLLSDLGAEVIKVEDPRLGDGTRAWGPPFIDGTRPDEGHTAYFHAANRNKRCIAVDFARPEGALLIRALARQSHILIENFKTGGLARYGLDYDSLRADNPALVYCSITGFGHTSPDAHRPGYDYLMQAMGGFMSITGQPDGAPGAEPMRAGVAVADLFTGMYASTAMLAALRHAERSGEGQHIDLALLDCQTAVLANQAMNYLVSGTAPGRVGNCHPNVVPYQVFETADGHIVLAIGADGQFRAFCAGVGLPELAEDRRFATNTARIENRETLIGLIGPLFRSRTNADWFALLEAAGVPYGPIRTIDDVFDQPQIAARDMLVTLEGPNGVKQRYPGNPIKMSVTPPRYTRAPQGIGQSTDDVLSEYLGLSAEDIGALARQGIIGRPETSAAPASDRRARP